MANTYSWSFPSLDVELTDAEGHTDIVYTIHWRLRADDGDEHMASTVGTSSVKWEEGDPWIPYEDLTESDVQGWVEEDFGEEQLGKVKADLDAKIEEEVSPTHETKHNMPWNEDDGA